MRQHPRARMLNARRRGGSVPNLMNQMVQQNHTLNLQAVALGNACTGQPGQSKAMPGHCNLGGNFDLQHNIDLFYGHGMIAAKAYHKVYKACNFSCGPAIKSCSGPFSDSCNAAINEASDSIGDYNIYNIVRL